MVRVNLLGPEKLSDQHLIAEYNEILMLVAYIRKNPTLEGIPGAYCLGAGHMNFFKDKLGYLKERHEEIRVEMKKRGFVTNKEVNLAGLSKDNIGGWKPNKKDFKLIKERILDKINFKPKFYRYYGEYKNKEFFIGLLG